MATESFAHLSPETLTRVAEFLERGGRPLSAFESGVARRALRIAGDDREDAAALLYGARDGWAGEDGWRADAVAGDAGSAAIPREGE